MPLGLTFAKISASSISRVTIGRPAHISPGRACIGRSRAICTFLDKHSMKSGIAV
jgi:hypothetical protein